MKAAVYYKPMDIRWEEVDTPVCGNGELLIRIKASGICGTDVKTYRRGHHMFKPPVILGHEFAGEIAEVGSEIQGYSKGDRVIVAPYVPCGKCPMCRIGQFELCADKQKIEGAFAEYVKVSKEIVEKGMFKIPDNLSYTEASLVEPLACCLNAANDCNYHPGDTVVIVGAGPMGLINLAVAKALGAAKLITIEMNDDRRKLAESMGAIGINPHSDDVTEKVMEICGGRGADVLIIAVGLVEVAEQYMKLIGKGGTINLFGGFPSNSKLTIDPNMLHYDQVKLTGSFGFTPYYIESALNMISEGRIDINGIITHKMSMDKVKEAIDLILNQQALKVILYPEAGE